MTLYVIPRINDRGAELITLAARSGVQILEPHHLFEMYPEAVGGSMAIASLSDEQLTLLHRYMGELLPEVPTVVLSAPGVVYSSQWMMVASPLPSVDYMEISGKMAKTGLLAHSPTQVVKRGPLGTQTEVGAFIPAAESAAGQPGQNGRRSRPTFDDEDGSVPPVRDGRHVVTRLSPTTLDDDDDIDPVDAV